MLVFAVVASFLVIGRQREYRTYRNDMGNMVQVVDNTAHGRILQMTGSDGRQIVRLAAHVDPILALFALPWLIWPDPAMLLIVQAALVALAAWPVYRLGLRALGDPMAAAGCALAALLYPPLQFAVLDEFHPVTLAIPLLLFAFVFMEEERRWLALPFLVLAALCKEEIPLVIALMGLYFALRKRKLWPLLVTRRRRGVLPGRGGPDHPALQQRRVERVPGPVLRRRGQHAKPRHRTPDAPVAPRHDPAGAVRARLPVEAPVAVRLHFPGEPAHVPHQPARAAHQPALEQAAAAVDRLPLRGRRGSVRDRRDGVGLQRIGGWLARGSTRGRRAGPHRLHRLLVLLVVAIALLATFTMGPLSGARPGWGLPLTPEHRAVIAEALAKVPADASVSADNALGAQLSARERITTFPLLSGADYVVLDSQGVTGPGAPGPSRSCARIRPTSSCSNARACWCSG